MKIVGKKFRYLSGDGRCLGLDNEIIGDLLRFDSTTIMAERGEAWSATPVPSSGQTASSVTSTVPLMVSFCVFFAAIWRLDI